MPGNWQAIKNEFLGARLPSCVFVTSFLGEIYYKVNFSDGELHLMMFSLSAGGSHLEMFSSPRFRERDQAGKLRPRRLKLSFFAMLDVAGLGREWPVLPLVDLRGS